LKAVFAAMQACN